MMRPMPLSNALRNLAPEADLRSVVIRRRDDHVHAEDVKPALGHADLAAGLFFAKGHATAQAFRPSYWSYEEARDTESGEAHNAGRRDTAAIHEDSELKALERAFLASHMRALTQGPDPEPESDGTVQSDMSLLSPEEPDTRAPEADLRIIPLRRTMSDATLVDGLFARKNPAATEAAPKWWAHGPRNRPAR
jgi:hypothetical protein